MNIFITGRDFVALDCPLAGLANVPFPIHGNSSIVQGEISQLLTGEGGAFATEYNGGHSTFCLVSAFRSANVIL